MALLAFFFQNCSSGFQSQNGQEFSFSSLATSQSLSSKYAFGKSGLRRLSQKEVVRSVSDVFQIDALAYIDTLPSDFRNSTPFSNEFDSQSASVSTIESYQKFSEDYSAFAIAQAGFASKFSAIAGCTPASYSDRACLVSYLTKIGRRMLRRPFTTMEANLIADKVLPFANAEQKFWTAVELSMQIFIQSPAFLYRVEGATNITEPSLAELNDYEIATRLAFLIWGSGPDDKLLDMAESGKLKLSDIRVVEAIRMMQDLRAKKNWYDFHAEWMGYDETTLPASLKADMLNETNQLVKRVVFDENTDWLDLFRSQQTYLTPALATHYGMGSISSPGWVNYSGSRGGGIIAHATFLSKGAKFGDTSPTLRGYEIFKRLMCGKLGPIPDDVDPDTPPGNPTDCKPARYNMRNIVTCAGCHNVTDNIGFGLENFGVSGQWRTSELNKPQCVIDSSGSVSGAPYSGPTELAKVLSNSPQVSECAVTQLFRYFSGRKEQASDGETLSALTMEYLRKRSLQSLIVSLVQTPGFIHRVQ